MGDGLITRGRRVLSPSTSVDQRVGSMVLWRNGAVMGWGLTC